MNLRLLSKPPGSDILARLKSRERAVWNELVSEQYTHIFNLHLRLTGDREVAADLTQETFVAAYKSIHTFAGHCQPITWLYGVALNCNRNWRKAQGRHEPPADLDDDLPDPQPTAEELAALRARNHLICEAVQRLPETYRRTISLRYFVGLSVAEIAEGERVSAGTVRWRLHRAVRKLWVILKHDLGEENNDETGAARGLHIAP